MKTWAEVWSNVLDTEEPMRAPFYTREDLIRVVVGQQWSSMITFACYAGEYPDTDRVVCGDLPCAVDVVDGVG